MAVLGVLMLGILIPSSAVSVRRLHDTNRSGWWVLGNLIPFFGGLAILVLCALDGTAGVNRYGPDPKGRDATAEVFA